MLPQIDLARAIHLRGRYMKHQSVLYEKIKQNLSRDYLKEAFDLTEKDKQYTQYRIQSMAQDLYRLKSAFENYDSVKTYGTFQILVAVFEQQCEIKDDVIIAKKAFVVGTNSSDDSDKTGGSGVSDDSTEHRTNTPTPKIEIREKPLGEKIISTPHNTDAVYTRKRDQKVVGHKSFVTETCDPTNSVQMITDVSFLMGRHVLRWRRILERCCWLLSGRSNPKYRTKDAFDAVISESS